MKYASWAVTDTGARPVNQDSLLLKHAAAPCGETLLAVVSDGMGGHSCGEMASAAVVRAFAEWFDRIVPGLPKSPDLRQVGEEWTALLRELNGMLLRRGEAMERRLGATFSGLLLAGDGLLVGHVGDSRVYYEGQSLLGTSLRQLTRDQTLAAREAARGALSPEAAQRDSRRSVLMQSVGVTGKLEPQIVTGKAKKGVYLLCSDGFYHEIREKELREALRPTALQDETALRERAGELCALVKSRGERDNVSLLLIRAGDGRGETGGFRLLREEMLVHTGDFF